jgi:hypothetical protein
MEHDASDAARGPAPRDGGGAAEAAANPTRWQAEARGGPGADVTPGGPPRTYEPVEPRERRVLDLARGSLPEEIGLAEDLLASYLDLLGAVDEEYRLVWPAEESRVAFEACLLRLYDDLLATYYLALRGLYVQATRVWQDYLETLWLGLYFVRQLRAADRWLRGGRREPARARKALEEQGQLDPLSGELYTLLGQRSHPRAKQGFERALIIAHERGEWQVRFFVGGEGNAAWLRRALLDWLYLAAHGLDEIARLGIVPANARWSERRDALVAAAQRLVGEAPAPDAQTR